MALKPEQIDRLLSMIKKTREVEMTCPECLDQLDWYIQSDADGAPIKGVLEHVREHLDACPCCSMQLNLVLDMLKMMND
jgi:hypothetical protein